MNELGPDSRALLDAARDAHDPDAATRARLRSELLRRVGAGAAVAAAVTATTTKTTAAPLTSMMTKLVAVAALATGGVLLARHLTKAKPAPAPVVVAPQAQPAVTVLAPATTAAEPAPSPPAMAVTEEPPPAPAAKPVLIANKPKVAPPPPASTLEDELRALREAHVALRDGRPSEALSIVDGIKGSSLGPERAATRALALCALGRADGQATAEKFLASHPSSPLAPRVRAACAIPSE